MESQSSKIFDESGWNIMQCNAYFYSHEYFVLFSLSKSVEPPYTFFDVMFSHVIFSFIDIK